MTRTLAPVPSSPLAPEIASDPALASTMLAAVRRGLAGRQKELPPRFFDDACGAPPSEQVATLPEHSLAEREHDLLARELPALARRLRPRTVVELGTRRAARTRIVLDALRVADAGERHVHVAATCEALDALAVPLPPPVLYAFLGGAIGSHDAHDAVAILRAVRARLGARDRLLVGFDLHTSPARVERAYNDRRGVMAALNRNVLRVVDRALGADFDPDAFDHRAFYDSAHHRIEMHLVSVREQHVTVPGVGDVVLREGETIRTAVRRKFDADGIARLLGEGGLEIEARVADAAGEISMVVAKGI